MTDPITYELHQHAEVWLDARLAHRMRSRMDERGWTFNDLQALTGIPAQTLKTYLCGGKVVPLLRFNRICDVLCLCE